MAFQTLMFSGNQEQSQFDSVYSYSRQLLTHLSNEMFLYGASEMPNLLNSMFNVEQASINSTSFNSPTFSYLSKYHSLWFPASYTNVHACACECIFVLACVHACVWMWICPCTALTSHSLHDLPYQSSEFWSQRLKPYWSIFLNHRHVHVYYLYFKYHLCIKGFLNAFVVQLLIRTSVLFSLFNSTFIQSLLFQSLVNFMM